MLPPSAYCDHVGCPLRVRMTCSTCGGTFCARHIRWVRGTYYRSGYYACDACVRQGDASYWAAILTLAAIVLAPMIAFTGWMLSDFLQLAIRSFTGA